MINVTGGDDDTVGWATGTASGLLKTGCWFAGGDSLTGAVHVLQLHLSPPPPSPLAPIKSRMETCWYWLTQVSLGKMAIKTERNYDNNNCFLALGCPSGYHFQFLFNQPVFKVRPASPKVLQRRC